MSQRDVIIYLETQRQTNNKYYTATEIRRALKKQGISESALKNTHDNLRKLAIYGLIEWKGRGVWDHIKVFRAKSECE